MCLAALWPPVGKVAKAVVTGPAGTEVLDPLFWPSMFSAVSLFHLLAYFSLSVPLMGQYKLKHSKRCACQIDLAKVKTSSHRNMGYWSRREKT